MTEQAISGETAQAAAGRPRRKLWKAGLAGHVTMTTLVWAAVIAWLEFDNARLDSGHAFEDDRVVRPPALFTAEWLANSATVYGRFAFIALAYAVPLMLLLPHFERRGSAQAGLLAGAAASIPLAAAWVTIASLSTHSVPLTTFVAPALLLLLCGAAGGAVTARIRNGPRA